jgi:hypothetical protein
MATNSVAERIARPSFRQFPGTGSVALLVYVAMATIIIHLLTGHRYGFHRDELATLDDARHLGWGYVAYPPATPFFARVSLGLFGTSLTGFRFFAVLADAIGIVITGLMARELGGGRGAQMMAACAAIPFALGAGTLMQYVSFDYLWWVLVSYFVIRLLKSNDPRWWVAVGSAVGFGMLTKYSMVFCVGGIVAGVLLTGLRHQLKSKWLWIGVACSLLIFLPNFIWQVQHSFVSVDFLREIHQRDVRMGRTKDFLSDQVRLTLFAFPLAMGGLYYYFFSRNGRGFRPLGWMYLTPFVLFLIAQGRGYYLEPAYPLLFAGGSVWAEEWLGAICQNWSRAAWALIWAALGINISVTAAFMLPLAPINSRWWETALTINNDFAEEIGWPELVETVAQVRDSLPEAERRRLGILAGNYGEAGAINLYGPRYGLPTAISGINSFWQRGYGDPPPETLIVVGLSRKFLERNFQSCRVIGYISNPYGVGNEETTRHAEIFVCRGLRQSWPEFWKGFRYYG